MSQVSGPSVGEESPVPSKESPPKPPRYPSFRIRRAISRSPSRTMKQELRIDSATTRSRSEPTNPTMSESQDVSDANDGKLFHVRITLGYLKAIEKTKKEIPPSPRVQDTSLVTAFASLEPQVSKDHNFAQSLPLNPSEINNVVWPKQSNMSDNDTNKANRRLYFSIILQREDEDDDLRNVLTREDDMSTVTGTSAWNHHDETESFSPKLVKIQLGVARDKDLLHLGVATLIVHGNEVRGKQIDLPVRSLMAGEESSPTSTCTGTPKKSRGLKRFFSKGKMARSSFACDELQYSFTPNAILRIRLDVVSYASPLPASSIMSGPAVWGDGAEDDDDSFASVVVVDMSSTEATPREENDEMHNGETSSGNALTLANASESIEVVNDPTTGPSIIAAPPTYMEPAAADDTSAPAALPVSSVDIRPQEKNNPHTVHKAPLSPILGLPDMMCGFTGAFAPQAIEADVSQPLDFEDSSTIATSLYRGTREEAWKISAMKNRPNRSPVASVRSTASADIARKISLPTVDETAESSRLSSDSLSPSHRRSKASQGRSTESLSIGEDTVESLNEAKRALQDYAERTGINYDEMLEQLDLASSPSDLVSLERSIGDDTIDSLFEAKELLQRYADRKGMDVEEVLALDALTIDSYAGYSTDAFSPTSSSGARSTDRTELSHTTKSTRSRFSLFVDD